MTYAVMTDGMDHEQRAEFDRLLAEATSGPGGHDGEAVQRRAFALAYGEQQ